MGSDVAAQSHPTVKAGMADASASNPGPQNSVLGDMLPASGPPPVSDHGSVKQFWSSMRLARRRVQEGGWARQVNVVDLPISKDIAGVNMRLEAGGIRESHWHTADGWAIMPTGKTRITAARRRRPALLVVKPSELHWHQNADEWQFWISGEGLMTLFADHSHARTIDLDPSDVGYAPATLSHSIENTGTDDLVHLGMFEAPVYRDVSLDDWSAALPPELVKQHLGEETLAAVPKAEVAIVPPGKA